MSHVPRISTLQRSTVTVHINSDAPLIQVGHCHQMTIASRAFSSTYVFTNAHETLTLKLQNEMLAMGGIKVN